MSLYKMEVYLKGTLYVDTDDTYGDGKTYASRIVTHAKSRLDALAPHIEWSDKIVTADDITHEVEKPGFSTYSDIRRVIPDETISLPPLSKKEADEAVENTISEEAYKDKIKTLSSDDQYYKKAMMELEYIPQCKLKVDYTITKKEAPEYDTDDPWKGVDFSKLEM